MMRKLLAILLLLTLMPTPALAADDEGQAFQKCMSEEALTLERAKAAYSSHPEIAALFHGTGCPLNGEKDRFVCTVKRRSDMSDVTCGSFPFVGQCSARPFQTGWKGGPTAGTIGVCHEGCTYTSALDASSPNGISFDPTGSRCTTDDTPAPEPDDPGDGGDDGGGGGSDTGGGDTGGGGDGDGDGDGTGDPGGEQPNVPSPEYPGDIPMPWAEGTIPSTPDGQWSSGLGGGSCPASKSVAVGLGGVSTTVNFSFQPLCDFATLIRGLVLACAAIASAYIIAGVRK